MSEIERALQQNRLEAAERRRQIEASARSYRFGGYDSQGNPQVRVDAQNLPTTVLSNGSLIEGELVAPFPSGSEVFIRGRDSIGVSDRRRIVRRETQTPINLWWSKTWGGVADLRQFGAGDRFVFQTYPYGVLTAQAVLDSNDQIIWLPNQSICMVWAARLIDIEGPSYIDWNIRIEQDPLSASEPPSFSGSTITLKVVNPEAPINQASQLSEVLQVLLDASLIDSSLQSRQIGLTTPSTSGNPRYSTENFPPYLKLFSSVAEVRELLYAHDASWASSPVLGSIGFPNGLFLKFLLADPAKLQSQGLEPYSSLGMILRTQSQNLQINLTNTGAVINQGTATEYFNSSITLSGALEGTNALEFFRQDNGLNPRVLDPGRYLIYQSISSDAPLYQSLTGQFLPIWINTINWNFTFTPQA